MVHGSGEKREGEREGGKEGGREGGRESARVRGGWGRINFDFNNNRNRNKSLDPCTEVLAMQLSHNTQSIFIHTTLACCKQFHITHYSTRTLPRR